MTTHAPIVPKIDRLAAPPAPDVLPLPPVIAAKLAALARRELGVRWTEGALLALGVVAALILVQVLLDRLFDLPLVTRGLLLLGDFAALGWVAWRWFIAPWRGRLSPDAAALRAQRHWPELCSALISAVQLARGVSGSKALVHALLAQVAARIATLDFRQAVRSRHLRFWAGGAAAAVALTGGLLALWWPDSAVLLRRIALSREPLPTRTRIVALTVAVAMPPGQPAELAARTEGEVPRAGRVEIVFADGARQTVELMPKPATPDRFEVTVPNVQQPFTYRFLLGDARGAEYRVTVLRGPVLEALTFEQEYPAYTQLARTPHTAGNLKLLAGSQLYISARASHPVKRAVVDLRGLERTAELAIDPAGQALLGAIEVPANGLEGFSIRLEDRNGVPSQNDTFYAVQLTPDRPPEVAFAPGQPERITFTPEIPPTLRFSVRDDFAIGEVALVCEVSGAEPRRFPLKGEGTPAALGFDWTWNFPPDVLARTEGTTIRYWIEATDNNTATGPGVTRTAPREWQIVSLAAKREELAERLRAQAETMQEMSRTQDDVRRGVNDLLKSQTPKP